VRAHARVCVCVLGVCICAYVCAYVCVCVCGFGEGRGGACSGQLKRLAGGETHENRTSFRNHDRQQPTTAPTVTTPPQKHVTVTAATVTRHYRGGMPRQRVRTRSRARARLQATALQCAAAAPVTITVIIVGFGITVITVVFALPWRSRLQ